MQCVILAGGLGTRMRPLTDRLPKALLPVNGEPFASHQLRWLTSQGVTEVVFSIGRHGELIRNFVRDGRRWGASVRYLEDGPQLLGTAGALRQGLASGTISSPFITVYGDSYLPIELVPVVDAFEAAAKPALMTVHRNEGAWDASNAVFVEGMVSLYDKKSSSKPPNMVFIDYGLSILTSGPLEAMVQPGEAADLSDLFHSLSLRGDLAGFEATERFYEVGSPEGLAALEGYLASVRRPR